jgi:hypothetical protein
MLVAPMIISASLRRQVIERAENCCEYWGLAQTGSRDSGVNDFSAPFAAANRPLNIGRNALSNPAG